ncbi:MAG: type IV pilin protein [Candidatus Avelusimicrobium sp.]|uniref:type IV pilin protein n=1 Tax=Candidatus Avelusimicrobium sp. TaxID=3048833 RepID=UPI003F031CC5
MYQKVVITGMDLGSGLFNSSCKPYNNLDSRFTMRCPGMTKRGFTLIELLVVVLIIGILSSVALPQYQAAVEKSRYVQLMSSVDAVARAQELYYLANGNYSARFDGLDLELPAHCSIRDNPNGGEAVCPRYSIDLFQGSNKNIFGVNNPNWLRGELRYIRWLEHSDRPSVRECSASTEVSRRVCRSLGGTDESVSGGWYAYILP